MENKLTLTLAEQKPSDAGIPVAAVVAALEGLQDAMRLMVGHLVDSPPKPGRPSDLLKGQSLLRVAGTRAGSLVLDLDVDDETDAWIEALTPGRQALDALLRWNGAGGSTLPEPVVDRLYAIPAKLPRDVRLWLGAGDHSRRVELTRKEHPSKLPGKMEEALLHGWLKEVNWDKRTARLYVSFGKPIALRFSPELDDDMHRLARQFVEISGKGRFNANDQWITVEVHRLTGTRSWNEPFDMEAFLNNPNPKIFNPDEMITASEPFDVDEFIRIIHEGRDVGRKEAAD